MNWFEALIRSRKFWLAVLDAAVSTISVVATAVLSPEQVDTVLLLVGIWQPVFVALIAGIAYEDGKSKGAGNHHSQKTQGDVEYFDFSKFGPS